MTLAGHSGRVAACAWSPRMPPNCSCSARTPPPAKLVNVLSPTLRIVTICWALVSPEYFDDAGTSVKDDDVDYAHLAAVLTDTFARTSQLRLELGVTAIDVKGDRATVDLFYDVRYRVTTPRREIPKRDSDVQRLILRRDGQSWRIASGL